VLEVTRAENVPVLVSVLVLVLVPRADRVLVPVPRSHSAAAPAMSSGRAPIRVITVLCCTQQVWAMFVWGLGSVRIREEGVACYLGGKGGVAAYSAWGGGGRGEGHLHTSKSGKAAYDNNRISVSLAHAACTFALLHTPRQAADGDGQGSHGS